MARKRADLWAVGPATRALALERLAESGIDETAAEALGIEALEPGATVKLSPNFQPRPSLYLPYFDPDGAPSKANPAWSDFFRIRYLGDPPPSFADQTRAKPRRYAQPPETGVLAYYPRLPNTDWEKILANPNEALIVTEGELKAACTTAAGYPTIGLGGVWSWRSAEMGLPFLPSLERVSWLRRKVYLAFDSDFRSNKNVCSALMALAEALSARGAAPEMITVPELSDGGKKTGLDDFVMEAGIEALGTLIAEAQPLTLSRVLWGLNDEVTYVRDPGLVVERGSRLRLATEKFAGPAYASRPYAARVLGEDGGYTLKPQRATAAWLNWIARAETARLSYLPGQPQEVEVDGEAVFNLWRGWGCKAIEGPVDLWNALLDHLFGGEVASREYFERWCAYPLQFPGVKMTVYAMIHGRLQGTGKSTVMYVLARIYGENFAEIKQDDMHTGFNEWAECKQLVLVDDVSGALKRQEADTIKKMITQKTLRVNKKYLPSYEVPDVINYGFTSNHDDALLLDDDDRRGFIHEADVDPLPMKFYRDLDTWLDTGGGKEALFYHLLHLDLGDFDPFAPALKTGARSRMILDGKSDLGQWVAALRGDPEGVLRLGEAPLVGDLFTPQELRALYDPERTTRITDGFMARELKRAGLYTVLDDMPLHDGRDRLSRFFVVRNFEFWDAARVPDAEAHLAKRYGRRNPVGRPKKRGKPE